MFSTSIGIDLGTSTVLVYVRGKGIILREPSVVAIRREEQTRIEAVGQAAYEMLGRTPKTLHTIRPLSGGVISNYQYTEKMLKYFVQRTIGKRLVKPVVAVCIPCKVTEVERKAFTDACYQVGARSVHMIEEPIAAAMGAGLDISRPNGCMIIDIGGGTADIAVISLGGIVVSTSVKVAGDDFDEAIIRHIKKKYNLLIGERTAENIKIQIGTVSENEDEVVMEVKGRHMITGLPVSVMVSSYDVREALQESVRTLVEAVHGILEQTPPELAADIYEHGIVMTGGGSLLRGIDEMISRETQMNVFVADDAISCVAIGTGRYVEQLAEKRK
ncbi:MAG: rod shape-determining protein [Lachnospiraceae bacterium]|jgi:rod shape-determining protein MreB|nr:rod shape-determining protein [Lachnospiraceae bacterium]